MPSGFSLTIAVSLAITPNGGKLVPWTVEVMVLFVKLSIVASFATAVLVYNMPSQFYLVACMHIR